jgi:hypothetical protein
MKHPLANFHLKNNCINAVIYPNSYHPWLFFNTRGGHVMRTEERAPAWHEFVSAVRGLQGTEHYEHLLDLSEQYGISRVNVLKWMEHPATKCPE